MLFESVERRSLYVISEVYNPPTIPQKRPFALTLFWSNFSKNFSSRDSATLGYSIVGLVVDRYQFEVGF